VAQYSVQINRGGLHNHRSKWLADTLSSVVGVRDNRTREREVNALTTVMQETGITHATIVSLDSEERIETDAGVVNVLPAWLWSLRFLTILQK